MAVKKEKTARVGTPGPMIKEHGQQQVDKYEVLLKIRATQSDQAARTEKRVWMFQMMFLEV